MNGSKPTYTAIAPSEGAKTPNLKRDAPDTNLCNRRSTFLLAILVGLVIGSIGTLWFITPSGSSSITADGLSDATKEELEDVLLNNEKEASQQAHVQHGDELPDEERPAETPRTGDPNKEGPPNGPKDAPPADPKGVTQPKGGPPPQPKAKGPPPPNGDPKTSVHGPERPKGSSSGSRSRNKSGVRGSKSKDRPLPKGPPLNPKDPKAPLIVDNTFPKAVPLPQAQPKQGPPPQPKQGPPPQPKQGPPPQPKQGPPPQPKQGPPPQPKQGPPPQQPKQGPPPQPKQGPPPQPKHGAPPP